MGELLLVRHGETEWTLSRRHTSHTDLPLTENGEEQARAVAAVLARRRIALALTSPLQRAKRTADLAGLRHAQVEPDLREWDYGGYEGLTTSHIRRERPGWVLWTDGVAPGPGDHPGESPEQVAERVDRVLAQIRPILGDNALGDVVLVAHGHLLRVLTARQLGLPPAAGAMFRLDTGTVSTLSHEHGLPVVSTWNETPRPDGYRAAGAPRPAAMQGALCKTGCECRPSGPPARAVGAGRTGSNLSGFLPNANFCRSRGGPGAFAHANTEPVLRFTAVKIAIHGHPSGKGPADREVRNAIPQAPGRLPRNQSEQFTNASHLSNSPVVSASWLTTF